VNLFSVQGVLGSFLQFTAHAVFALPNRLLRIHCLQCVVTYLDGGHRSPLFKSPNSCHSDTGGPDCRDTFCEQPDTCFGERHLGQFSYVENCRNVSHCKTARIKLCYLLLCSFFLIFWFSPLCLSSCLCSIVFLFLFFLALFSFFFPFLCLFLPLST